MSLGRGGLGEARAGALAFLAAAATLFLQVLAHRIVSAKLLNNYAFVVISLTMLGFALAGVALSFLRERALARLADTAILCASGFAVSALVATAALNGAATKAPYGLPAAAFALAFLAWLPFALLFALPFAFAGFLLGALLAAPDLPTRRVYFLDLLGSAVGAFVVLPVLSAIGVESALLLVAAALLVLTVAVVRPTSRRVAAALVVAAAVVLGGFVFRGRVFAIHYPEGSILAQTRDPRTGVVLEHVAWDPLARIEVSRIPPPDPGDRLFLPLLGTNRAFISRFSRMLTQNNYAYTFAVRYDGNPASLQGIEETLYAAAYPPLSVDKPRVIAIGVGGGFDILTALHFGASEVTGVEVNGAILGVLRTTYRDYFRSWVEDPRVRLVHDEGRHFLSTTDRSFDVIQLSGVDSYSGTPAAAHVFSENYLYTAEAFDLYLSRLTPNGILHMMRLEYRPPREMLRALVTAVAALRRAGIAEPERHVVTLTAVAGNITSLLVKRTPFSAEELARVTAWAEGREGFSISAAPGQNDPPRNAYQQFLIQRNPGRERAFAALYPFDVSPTDDDRPFFFRGSRWSHLVSSDPLLRGHTPVMEVSLVLLFVVVGGAAVLVVILPLRALPPPLGQRGRLWRYGLYFAATGLGYLAVEVALLQKFGLFLGHPSYALSVVLAFLLLFTGMGSLVSATIVGRLRGIRFAAYALAFVVLAEHLLLLPHLGGLASLPFWARSSLVALLVAPVALLLGVFLPTALERLKQEAPSFVPWAWGLNGVFSVLAPILSVSLTMTFGISALLLAALPLYMIAGLCLPDP